MVLVLVLLLTQAVQQTPPRDTKPSAGSGTAVIAGRVVDAETGAPIGGALLQIGPMKIGERPTQVEAGPRGEFRLDRLAAGDYTIMASPPEFRATHLPQVHNGDFSQLMSLRPSVQLASGEKLEDLVIRLPRAFAVDGTVVDEFGDPMANISVRAELLQASAGGGFPIGIDYSQTTDDRGSFRLFRLVAGAYRICATPETDFQSGPVSSGDVLERRNVKTCYPSSPAGGGERVTINASAAPILTIVMQRSAGYTISGRATSESGSKNLRVSVRQVREGGSGEVNVEMQEGGRFVSRGATPGKYRVSAYAGEGTLFESSAPEQAKAVVEVGAADISGIELVTTKGASLIGRIVPAESLPAGTKLSVMHTLGIAALATGEPNLYKPVRVREDLTFELTGIREGVLFEVSGLPDGWVLASVRYRGADVTDTSIAVTSTTDPRDLEIHVSPRSAQIIARPIDAEARPVSGAFALLFPATGDRFSPQPMLGAPKVREGVQDLGHVRPGEYRVVALAFTDLFQLSRYPSGFALLRDLGQVVTVTTGQRLTVDVVVRSLPEVR